MKNTIHYKTIEGTPFRLEISSIENAPGTWNSSKVSIFRDAEYDINVGAYRKGKLIGEYIRNYSSFGAETFCPFEIDNQWYALYSTHYTATRVMRLNDTSIEDWCGEDPSSHGFCPMELYVPRYRHSVDSTTINGVSENFDLYMSDGEFSDIVKFLDLSESPTPTVNFCKFGFVSGCVWGDDSSRKLKYIDLSKIPEKILNVTELLGYWEIPNGKSIRECVDLSGWEPSHDWVRIVRSEVLNLATGERA